MSDNLWHLVDLEIIGGVCLQKYETYLPTVHGAAMPHCTWRLMEIVLDAVERSHGLCDTLEKIFYAVSKSDACKVVQCLFGGLRANRGVRK